MYHEKRPWGEFWVLNEGPGYKVKRLQVNPGARLSLQSHMHRSEQWTVVSGQATVTVGPVHTVLHKRQSIEVPLGAVHRLENLHTVPLQVIEVAFGDYIGEDDIIRYSDIYNRISR